MVKNIQSFMALPLDGPEKESPVSKDSSEDKSGSLNEYPSYDSQAPQTAMIPLPPQVIPAGDDSGGSGGPSSSSGGGEDPFEAFYAHPGGLV